MKYAAWMGHEYAVDMDEKKNILDDQREDSMWIYESLYLLE